MVKIQVASDIAEPDTAVKIADIYVNGFYDVAFKYFSKDKEKLKKAAAEMLLIQYFYVAEIDSEIAGIIACVEKSGSYLNIDKKPLTKHLGLFRGLFAYFALKNYYKKLKNWNSEKTAIIDCLVTNPAYRGKGVATALIEHLFALPEYNSYLLEVADTNINAVELYKKLGFKETHRKKGPYGSGINYFLYMKYSKE
ncbi:MAG: GNAT family N-acetyltransferase [Methanosarcinales archaeon]|nr:GNAT family N-acetyltransferase [Methanosarcinales archaeon]